MEGVGGFIGTEGPETEGPETESLASVSKCTDFFSPNEFDPNELEVENKSDFGWNVNASCDNSLSSLSKLFKSSMSRPFGDEDPDPDLTLSFISNSIPSPNVADLIGLDPKSRLDMSIISDSMLMN
jgi:hypothetical protein